MIKQLLRSCVAAGCRGSGMLARAHGDSSGELAILCYHRVLPAEFKRAYFAPDLVVTPESFREHCRVLSEYFEVLPLSRAVDAWPTRSAGDRPLVVITFDDGYQDNFHFAAPILAEAGMQATFFVVSDLVGRGCRPWYDQLAHLLGEPSLRVRAHEFLNGRSALLDSDDRDAPDRFANHVVSLAKDFQPAQRRELIDQLESAAAKVEVPVNDTMMTSDQLRALQAAGHEIGSHSRTHEMLPQLDDETLALELAGSRRQLEEMLEEPIRSFCYPNGSMDHRVVQQVRAAGYARAVTTELGRNRTEQDRYRLKRWFIHEDRLSGPGGAASGTLLRMEILGLSDRMFARGRRRAAHA